MSIEHQPSPEEMGFTQENLELEKESADLVDDVDKARVMAEAGDIMRTSAAKFREKAADDTYIETLRDDASKRARFSDKNADLFEADAALSYDVRKIASEMTSEELLQAADQAIIDEKQFRRQVLELRQKEIDANDADRPQLRDQLFILEKQWRDSGLRAHILNNMIGERKRAA